MSQRVRSSRGPWVLALVGAFSVHGCIKAPPIAVVDNRTALEIQAAGEYPVLEFETTDAALEPGPTPASAKEIASKSGLAAAGQDLDVFIVSESQALFIDSMLILGCLGEGENGLLEYTPNRCSEDVEVSELLRAASRNNLHRRQIWQYLASKRENGSIQAATKAWRSVHLEQVRCGTWIEQDGTWTQKAC
jgi:hypothetical protein